MVVSVNEAEMEDNGVFCSALTVVCWGRFIGDVGVVVVGSPFAVPCGNRPVSGAGGGLEEPIVQANLFARVLIWSH